jgi:2-oxoglutarate dehydrogenase E2 component (dihydrolipoamide succinyltransferase)
MPDLPKRKDGRAVETTARDKDRALDPAARRRPDHTGAIVAAGLALLALIGVGTIFADPIRAALAPPAATGGGEVVTPAPAPAPASSGVAAAPAPTAPGGPVAPAAPVPAPAAAAPAAAAAAAAPLPTTGGAAQP